MIKIKNIKKNFGDNEVLKGIDLSVDYGEVVSIIGPSGCGKSTFLRCIDFLEVPDEGTIEIDDFKIDAEEYKYKEVLELRQHSSMIFQDFNLFANKTVIENITEPLIYGHGIKKDEAVEIAKKNLAKIGMLDKADVYPATLSGGQKQRVGIARSVSTSPKLLLFDEPTSALDPQWVSEILDLIKSLVSNERAMLIVTHEMKFAEEISDKVIFFNNGHIEEEGSPDYIFHNSKSEITKSFLSASIHA